MKFTVPASLEDATAALTGVERLLTAKEWERCAIVAAFVTLGEGKGKGIGNATSSISPVEFAALGYNRTGMSPDTTGLGGEN